MIVYQRDGYQIVCVCVRACDKTRIPNTLFIQVTLQQGETAKKLDMASGAWSPTVTSREGHSVLMRCAAGSHERPYPGHGNQTHLKGRVSKEISHTPHKSSKAGEVESSFREDRKRLKRGTARCGAWS